jgi:HemY protein
LARALWFFLLAAVFAFVAASVASEPGSFVLTWGTTQYAMSLPVAAGVCFMVIVAILLLYRVFAFFVDVPGATSRWAKGRRRDRGVTALSRGLVAVAAGDPGEARAQANRARALLDHAPLTRLLSAQAAQLDGDEEAVAANYRDMLGSPETEFLGLRGLFMQAMRRRDIATALDYAKRAFAIRPKAQWVVNALFDLHSQQREWADAVRALEAAVRAKVIDDGVAKRRRAVLYAAEALDRDAEGEYDVALERALAAIQYAPGLAPAAALAAKELIRNNRTWKAAGVIEAAWEQSPHPDLAALYADLKPNEEPAVRAKRFAGLIELNRDHPESRLLAAAQAVAIHDYAKARDAIAPLLSPAPTARVCLLMADIEGQTGDVTKRQEWLARSVRAPRDAYWSCQNCTRSYAGWSPVCLACNAFDSLEWKAPAEAQMGRLRDAELDPVRDVDRLLYRQPQQMLPPPQAEAAAIEPAPQTPRASPVSTLPTTSPQPVIFELPRRPDDPGPDAGEPKRKEGRVW